MDPKPWTESRTIIANSLSLVAALLTAALGVEWIIAYPRVAAGLTAGLAFVNLALRFVTSQPLGPIVPRVEAPRP